MYLSFDINKFLWCEIQAVLIIHNIQQKGYWTLFSSTFIHVSSQKHVTDADNSHMIFGEVHHSWIWARKLLDKQSSSYCAFRKYCLVHIHRNVQDSGNKNIRRLPLFADNKLAHEETFTVMLLYEYDKIQKVLVRQHVEQKQLGESSSHSRKCSTQLNLEPVIFTNHVQTVF